MATTNRLINNLYKKNKDVARKLTSIERKYGLLDGNSPIPNQIFDSEINKLNQSSCLFFSQKAHCYNGYYRLQYLFRYRRAFFQAKRYYPL